MEKMTTTPDEWVNKVAENLSTEFSITCTANRNPGKAHFLVCITEDNRRLLLHNISIPVMYLDDSSVLSMRSSVKQFVEGEALGSVDVYSVVLTTVFKYIINQTEIGKQVPTKSINGIINKLMVALSVNPKHINFIIQGLELYLKLYVTSEKSHNGRYYVHVLGRVDTRVIAYSVAKEQGMLKKTDIPSEVNKKAYNYHVIKNIGIQYDVEEMSVLYTLLLVNIFGPPEHIIEEKKLKTKASVSTLSDLVNMAKVGDLSCVVDTI